MNLTELRKQYPQYDDLPDDKLVEGFHQKFYSDMPIEEFKTKLGIKPVEFSAGKMASNIPGSAYKFGADVTYPLRHPIKTAEGLGNLAGGVVDKLAHKLTNALPPEVIAKGNQFNNWLVKQGIPLAKMPEDRLYPPKGLLG